jgi:hypothetical protein
MTATKKHFKMEPRLVSKEPYEINYFRKKFKVPAKVTRQAKVEAGRSRVKIVKWLLDNGHINLDVLIKAAVNDVPR